MTDWKARAEQAESALARAIAERDRMAEALKEIASSKYPYAGFSQARASQALTTTTDHEDVE